MPNSGRKSKTPSRKPRRHKTAPVTPTPAPTPPTIPILKRLYQAFSKLSLTTKIVAGCLTLFGGYTGWISIQPQVSVELADPEFREEFPPFIISNSGYLAARNVSWDCDGRANIYVGDLDESQRKFDWDKPIDDVAYSSIGLLKPGRRVIRRCREVKLPAGTNLSPGTIIAPIVKYSSPIWPFKKTKVMIFGLKGDERLKWYWEFQGEPLEESEINELERQGYDINRLGHL